MEQALSSPGEEFLTRGHFCHISEWLPFVEDLTFETELLEFTHEEGRALQKLTEHSLRFAFQRALLPTGNAVETDPFAFLSEADRGHIEVLRRRLDKAIAVLSSDVFVRLDTRSPKDAVLILPTCRRLMRDLLGSRRFADVYSPECQTFDAACLHRAIIAAQRVADGREALDLLRHSKRVEADLVVGQVANQGDAASRLVVRRWCEKNDPLLELRAFVRAGEVSGLTQYYKTCYVPTLVAQRDHIWRLVCEAVETIHNRIQHLLPTPETLYSLDLALEQDVQGNFCRCILVEINPGPPVAGTVLFDWEDEEDRALLTRDPKVEGVLLSRIFRLVEKPVPWRSIPFHAPLKALAEEARGRTAAGWSVSSLRGRRWVFGAIALPLAAAVSVALR